MSQEILNPRGSTPPPRPILVYCTQALALVAFVDVAIRSTHNFTRAFTTYSPDVLLLVKQIAILTLLGSLSYALAARRRWGWHVGLFFIASVSALMLLAIFLPLNAVAPAIHAPGMAYYLGGLTACVLLVAISLAYPFSWYRAKSVRQFFRIAVA
jgi:hypothetical protein